jgi:hypothetical protein
LELATTLGHTGDKNSTLKALARSALANAFSVGLGLAPEPRVEATLGYN